MTTARRPLVLVDGRPAELPAIDTLAATLAEDFQEFDVSQLVTLDYLNSRIGSPAVPTIPGLVAYYKLNEISGPVIDEIGTHNGTNTGATPNVTGKYGTSYAFNGSNSIQFTGNLYATTAFTFCVWVYLTGSGARTIFCSTGTSGGAQFRFNDNNFPELIKRGVTGIGTATQAVSLNTWTHLAVTYEGTTVSFFVNGVAAGTTTNAQTMLLGGNDRLGRTDIDEGFTGNMDEFKVYNRVLTTAQIVQTMAASSVTNASVTGLTYTVITNTRAAVQAAIDAALSNSVITLAPGQYAGFDASNQLVIANKTNLTLEGFGVAELVSATTGDMLLIDGGNTRLKLFGVNFNNTGSGNSSIMSQIRISHRNNGNSGIEIARCGFTSPNLCQNAISATAYSVLGDGGDGTGGLSQNLHIHNNWFIHVGRVAIELVNHAWNDGKTGIYLRNLRVHHNFFRDLGTVAEPNGTKNGMAVSFSGYITEASITDNHILDPYLLGIEMAGINQGLIANNVINYINNPFTGISVSDNSHNATRNITINANNVRSLARCLGMNQIKEFGVTANTFVHDPASSTNAYNPIYFQACFGGSLSGGTITANSYNPVRLDDSSNMIVGGGLRIKNNDSNLYSLISLYGNSGTGNGAFNNLIGQDIFFEKVNGVASSGVVEAYGSQYGGNIGIR